jgi:hypothetical protein
MTLYELMGWISTVAVLIPIALLICFKLAWYRSMPALLGYFVLLFACNLFLLGVFRGSTEWREIQDVLHNTLAAPLSLIFLTYFARTIDLRRKMVIVSCVVLAFEIIIISVKGISNETYRLITAPGLIFALGFGLSFFANHVKLSIMYQKAAGKAFLVTTMLFATIGFTYIYIVRYFINPQYRQDADLIQFLVSLVIAMGVTVGLIFERKRVRQLEEVRIAREELKSLYGEEAKKTTGPFGTVAFNMDNEGWH